MRTAEEILIGKDLFSSVDLSNMANWPVLIDKINEARKEAIEECAKKVKLEYVDDGWIRHESGYYKASNADILSLINELK